jgi:cysteine desulfurase
VVEAMAPYWSGDFGNAASRTHRYGWRAEAAVELARERIAAALGASDPREVVFTSGATESDNLAIKGVMTALGAQGSHLVTVATEHKAVLDSAKHLQELGCRITVLAPRRDGLVDLDQLRGAMRIAEAGGAAGASLAINPGIRET